MKRDTHHQVLMSLREELSEAERRAEATVAAVSAIRNAIAVIERLPVEDPASRGDHADFAVAHVERASTSEMVTEIITNSDERWPVQRLYDEMVRRGWETEAVEPVAAVRAALQRLEASGVLVRVDRGVYQRVGIQGVTGLLASLSRSLSNAAAAQRVGEAAVVGANESARTEGEEEVASSEEGLGPPG